MNREICGQCGTPLALSKRHPGYVIGNHWLETAYERICAGEAEADVMADYGWTRDSASTGESESHG